MPAVTVIIPTYNRAHTLPRALNSVLEQSLTVEEIIVVDDGSTDETEALLKSDYPLAHHIKQINQGVSAARNAGIEQAKGEWIALLDSDDEWLPNKLETQLAQLKENPEYKIIHSDEIWIRNGVRVNPMKKHAKCGGWIFQQCLPLCAISPSAVMVHRDVFGEVGLFDEDLPACEDYDLWLRITACYPVLYCEEPLIKKYGGHDDQLSQKHWGMDRFRIRALDKCLNTAALEASDFDAARSMLLKKLRILLNGAHKYRNSELITEYSKLLNQWDHPDTNRTTEARP